MEFKDLEIFQLVAETGTVTQAAKALNYVQSNITSRIKKLEAEMNTPLFNRHRRGMSLTPEGKKLLTYSKQILELKEEMTRAVQVDQEPSGKLEIGTVESVTHLPQILSHYMNRYKQVDLSIFTGVTDALIKQVLDHELDGAFITKSNIPSELIAHEVYHEELVLISHPNMTTIEEVIEQPILCFSKGCGYRARLAEWYKDQQITPKKIMEFGTLETILRSATMGLGIAFVPKSEVVQLEQDQLIHFHNLPKQYSHIKTVFIRRDDIYLTPTIEKFIETIQFVKQKNAG